MTDWQKYNQLKPAVKAMRAAQAAYYAFKTQEHLKVAKVREKEVDRLLSDEDKNQLTLWA